MKSILLFICGSCLSSFLYCLVFRKTHKLYKYEKRSKCDCCGRELGIINLIPIFSYLLNKGKCKYCGNKINIVYPISEFIGGLIFVLIDKKYELNLYSLKYFSLAIILMLISFNDIETMIIPDGLIVFGIVNDFMFDRYFLYSLLKGLVIGGIIMSLSLMMKKNKGKEMIGGGDIKLIFMLSLYINVQSSLMAIIYSCLMGVTYSLLTNKTKECFPFGPFICLAYLLRII